MRFAQIEHALNHGSFMGIMSSLSSNPRLLMFAIGPRSVLNSPQGTYRLFKVHVLGLQSFLTFTVSYTMPIGFHRLLAHPSEVLPDDNFRLAQGPCPNAFRELISVDSASAHGRDKASQLTS